MVLDCRGLDTGIPLIISWLQRDGVLTPEKAGEVVDAMSSHRLSVEAALIEIVGVSDREIAQRYGNHYHLPVIDIPPPARDVAASLQNVLPEAFCRSHLLVPVALTKEGVRVAVVDPSPTWLHSQISMMTGLFVEACVARYSAIERGLNALFPPSRKSKETPALRTGVPE